MRSCIRNSVQSAKKAPKKEKRKNKVISVRITEEQYFDLFEEFKESKISDFTEFCRFRLMNKNTESEAEKLQINTLLSQYATNFIRLRNFIQSSIFNSEEKNYFLKELSETIRAIREAIK